MSREDAHKVELEPDEFEAVVAALLEVDPKGISGKHDAKKRKAEKSNDDD